MLFRKDSGSAKRKRELEEERELKEKQLEEERELKEKRMADDEHYHNYRFYLSSPRGGATSRQKMAQNNIHGDIY